MFVLLPTRLGLFVAQGPIFLDSSSLNALLVESFKSYQKELWCPLEEEDERGSVFLCQARKASLRSTGFG
jgi:hypothetical protein